MCVRLLEVLRNWLNRLLIDREVTEENIQDCCRMAWDSRRSPEMAALKRKMATLESLGTQVSIAQAFRMIRHLVGRLAHHVRAVKDLIEDATELHALVDSLQIQGVPHCAANPRPSPDGLTTLSSMLKRMLEANNPQLSRLDNALALMDRNFHVQGRVDEVYSRWGGPVKIHAEVRVLEHFHRNMLIWAFGERHVAASKPACFCCDLYFRHHPSLPMALASHHNIYLDWGVPLLEGAAQDVRFVEQRRILATMLTTIKDQAVRQIRAIAAPHIQHPDSTTGITTTLSHVSQRGLEALSGLHTGMQELTLT